MGFGTKRFSAILLGVVFTISSAAAAQDVSREAKKAKAYVAEVQKHLLESFVDRDKLSKEGLNETGLKGLESGLEKLDLDADLQYKIFFAIQHADSIADAIVAVDEIVGDEDFEFLEFADGATHAMVKSTGDPFSGVEMAVWGQ